MLLARRITIDTAPIFSRPGQPDFFFWPPSGKFPFFYGHLFACSSERAQPWALEGQKSRIALQAVLGDRANDWIDLYCTSAIVPTNPGPAFELYIAGYSILKFDHDLSASFARRLKLKKLSLAPTLCRARIDGGGLLSGGRPRTYAIHLDIKRFRWQMC